MGLIAAIMKQYAEGPKLLEAALEGLEESDLDAALAQDSWSIRQIVHHIADGDDIWKVCIKMALGNPQAVFDLAWYWAIPQNRWAELWGYDRREVDPSLKLFAANRRHVVQLIESIPGGWERTITLRTPQGDEQISVGWVVEMQARHVIGHIQDIEKIRGKESANLH